MFGEGPSPKPPRYEALLVLGLGVAIAAALTLGYYGLLVFAERLAQAG